MTILTGLLLAATLVVAGGCGSSTESPAASPDAPAGDPYDDPYATSASCDEFSYWQEAQDALDADSSLESSLDDDHDGVACHDLGQSEYEEAWPTGYGEACEAVYAESPDGVLYLDGTGYEQSECDISDPGVGPWEADSTGDPEMDGKRDAWAAACDEFFNTTVGGDLYWGDDVEVTQSDCEYASPY